MTAHFNIDEVVKHLKTIADNNRCGTCDKLSGKRLRYPCGHIICEECVVEADECLTCIDSSKTEPVLDVVQGQLVENVSHLLTTFQDTFNIDVNRRHRLSEKLKVERQLFPECIQASAKYYNKRRSSHIPTGDNKENLIPSFYAGETLNKSHSTTMNTRISLVQQWLEKAEKPVRKPFSDINVNRSLRSNRENTSNKGPKLHNKQNDLKKKSKKKINLKTNISTKSKNNKNSNEVLSPSVLKYFDHEKLKSMSKPETRFNSTKKYDNSLKVASNYENENNSDVDDIDTIVIEDTQTQVVDKDKNAWFKVLEASKNSNYFKDKPSKSLEQKALPAIPVDLQSDTQKNVYFYKKDLLFKSCLICSRHNDTGTLRLENQRLNSNNVKITINTNSILSTITVLKDEEENIDKVITRHSVEIQTDEETITVNNAHQPKQYLTPSAHENISSPDLFVEDIKKGDDKKHYSEIVNDDHSIGTSTNSNFHCVIIDSDSDADMDCSGPMKVSVDVHRSNETDGVLTAVDCADYHLRPRRSGRRRTVDSNNSSEKENVEPNRIKRPRLGKKQGLKK